MPVAAVCPNSSRKSVLLGGYWGPPAPPPSAPASIGVVVGRDSLQGELQQPTNKPHPQGIREETGSSHCWPLKGEGPEEVRVTFPGNLFFYTSSGLMPTSPDQHRASGLESLTLSRRPESVDKKNKLMFCLTRTCAEGQLERLLPLPFAAESKSTSGERFAQRFRIVFEDIPATQCQSFIHDKDLRN
ncbi:hypothetical protein Y1Q_0019515 [Alligator mississippiensis]|uniref:Uncharacterized protein n=1 Tax=Alligator mississippiensis TaxID=8496 RepID=A0A151NMK9_ALLMI|nr:hypothetical protein Y1Q_0019515 [Alligator mississippiensis]